MAEKRYYFVGQWRTLSEIERNWEQLNGNTWSGGLGPNRQYVNPERWPGREKFIQLYNAGEVPGGRLPPESETPMSRLEGADGADYLAGGAGADVPGGPAQTDTGAWLPGQALSREKMNRRLDAEAALAAAAPPGGPPNTFGPSLRGLEEKGAAAGRVNTLADFIAWVKAGAPPDAAAASAPGGPPAAAPLIQTGEGEAPLGWTPADPSGDWASPPRTDISMPLLRGYPSSPTYDRERLAAAMPDAAAAAAAKEANALKTIMGEAGRGGYTPGPAAYGKGPLPPDNSVESFFPPPTASAALPSADTGLFGRPAVQPEPETSWMPELDAGQKAYAAAVRATYPPSPSVAPAPAFVPTPGGPPTAGLMPQSDGGVTLGADVTDPRWGGSMGAYAAAPGGVYDTGVSRGFPAPWQPGDEAYSSIEPAGEGTPGAMPAKLLPAGSPATDPNGVSVDDTGRVPGGVPGADAYARHARAGERAFGFSDVRPNLPRGARAAVGGASLAAGMLGGPPLALLTRLIGTAIARTGSLDNAQPYQGLMRGGAQYARAGMTPYGTQQYQGPYGTSNSPFTPAGSGWNAPNYSSGSGGSLNAWRADPNNPGHGTYIDSRGNEHPF